MDQRRRQPLRATHKMAAQLTQLRQLLKDQQEEMERLCARMEQQEQALPNEQERQQAPPIQPEEEVPHPAHVPIAPIVVREIDLYEKFRRMNAPNFEGTTKPLVADNWLTDI